MAKKESKALVPRKPKPSPAPGAALGPLPLTPGTQSVAPQERVFKHLKERMKVLVKDGYLDRFQGQDELDGCRQDPGVYDRIMDGFDPLTEMAIFSIRPDIHKPIRLMAMAKIAEYTHTKADLQTRLESAAAISNITIQIEGYARGLPAKAEDEDKDE